MNDDRCDLTPAEDLLQSNLGQFGTILADPPWQFANRTGKMAPEHKRLLRYPTMTLNDILNLPVSELSLPQSHSYLWVPNALIAEGLEVMKRWGFTYKTNLVWYKIRKDGGPDGPGRDIRGRPITSVCTPLKQVKYIWFQWMKYRLALKRSCASKLQRIINKKA